MTTKQFLPMACLLLLGTGMPTQAGDAPSPTQVTTTRLEQLLFKPEYTAPATALSLNDSRIGAETSGRILKLPVRVGDLIRQGDSLGELDCQFNEIRRSKAQASVRAARSRVTLATRQIERSRSLKRERNISEELYNQRENDLQTANADLAALESTLEEARLAVEHCRLIAPFTGVVMERLAGEGEWVSPGQPLVRLLDSERLEVSAQVSVDRVDSLRAATSLELVTNRGRFTLQVRRLVPFVNSRGRTLEVRLEFMDRSAMPGAAGRLVWQDHRPHVPADLPIRRDNQLGLILADGNQARFLPLPDALEGHPAAVDLPSGTQLVVEGRQGLSHGDPIQVLGTTTR
ncbi:MAG: efflux RND transporter periplasmic adaptor subunit [Gammaproteobacteria bacterium]|nr:efflux RND transporter periplasmic adaptor subunit [Gammaproteobacteria bacterium]